MRRQIMPHLVHNQALYFLQPEDSVAEAVALMSEQHIGAVMVVRGGQLIGIFTERDVVTRVVNARRDPDATLLSEVMTEGPQTIAPGETAGGALELMARLGCRHLPVVDGEEIVGMVSIRDLFGSVREQLEQDLKQRDALLFDTTYGVG
ncbi:MAG: CBS domain-containing protein [Tistlia sp.]|uniref:CBS domain-containing protein n=1 Tax=Tistlia sp. TaxID=3057121 RepID=UPI0034A0F3E7